MSGRSKSDLPSRMTRRRLPMSPGLSPRLSLTSPDLRQSRLSQSVRQEDHSCSHPLGRDRERQSTCGGPPRRRGRYPFRSYRGSHTQPTSVETCVGGGFAIPYGTSKSWVVEKRLTLSRRRPSASVPTPIFFHQPMLGFFRSSRDSWIFFRRDQGFRVWWPHSKNHPSHFPCGDSRRRA
jgi:hypothetical protein